MSGCNATLKIGGHELPCTDCFGAGPDVTNPHRHCSIGLDVFWNDDAPGAKPHTPPRRYEAMYLPAKDTWAIRPEGDPLGDDFATFTRHHPDHKGAAKAEAARLNGEDDEPCCSDHGKRYHSLDPCVVRQARAELEALRRKCETECALPETAVERDAFRVALGRITGRINHKAHGSHLTLAEQSCLQIAREALEAVR